MKTIMPILKTLSTSTAAHIIFRIYFTPLFFALITLASCSSDDDGVNPDIAKIVGNYSVTDLDEDGEMETYSISIKQSKDGGLEISNFGDFMYVPVKATINGSNFNVPAQTFNGKSMIIVITGHGKLSGNQLTFDYTVETDDDFLLEHSCVASKGV